MQKKFYFLLVLILLCIPVFSNGMEYVTFNSGGLQYATTSETEVMLLGPELGPLAEASSSRASDPSEVTKLSIPATVNYEGKSYIVASFYEGAFKTFVNLTTLTIEDSALPIVNTTRSLFENLPIKTFYLGRDMDGGELLTNSKYLESLTFGDKVTTINQFMFRGNELLTTLDLGNGVKTINGEAFSGCTALKNLVIPASVTTFHGGSPFSNCTGLETVTFADAESPLETDNSNLFNDSELLKEIYIGRDFGENGGILGARKVEKVTFGGYATEVQDQMFGWCEDLKEVDLGNVKRIGLQSFFLCKSLKSIDLPDVCETVEREAFLQCTSLSSVKLSPAMTVLNCDAFMGCDSLKSIEIPANIMELKSGFVCSGLTTVTIADSDIPLKLEEGSHNLFCEPSSLSNIYIGRDMDWVNFVGNRFTLETVTFGDKVTVINQTFNGCENLTNLTLGKGITKIGDSAFAGCTGLKSIVIPEACDTISNVAFQGCASLEEITLSPVLTFIGNSAFDNCSSLKAIDIPGSVEFIDYGAFGGCAALESIKFLDSETPLKIGDGNFQSRLVCDLYIGRDLLYSYPEGYVKGYAFSFPETLNTVTFGDMATTVNDDMFIGNLNLKKVNLGNGVKTVGRQAFLGCSGLESVIFGKSVTNIEEGAFGQCPSIRDVVSLAEKAPQCADGAQTFAQEVYESAILSVPRGCKPSYRETDGWKQFMNLNSVERYKVSVTYNADGGNVKINGSDDKEIIVDCDEPLTFTVTTLPGYQVKMAVMNGEENLTEAFKTDSILTYEQIYSNMNLDVEFALTTYDIELSYNADGGQVTLNGESVNRLTVRKGSDVIIMLQPAYGYEVSSVTIDGIDVTSLFQNGTYTLSDVSANSLISVKFREIVYPDTVKLTILGIEGGNISIMVPYGKEAIIQVSADEDWLFHSLTCNGETYDSLEDGIFVTPPVVEETTVSVVFSKTSGVNSAQAGGLRVTTHGMEIVIDGKEPSQIVDIYSVGGITQYSGHDNTIIMESRGIYIVNVGGQTFKLAL